MIAAWLGLAEVGFDVLSMANNHSWDQGVDGMLETHRRVREAGMRPVGAGPTCEAARAPVVVEVKGVKVAFVAIADLNNLDEHDGEDDPCVFVAGPVCEGDCGPDRDAIHYSLDTERILSAVRAAEAAADVTVVSFHWGIEYTTTPLPEYPELARQLVEAGADVVLGHHPHVLQPVERIDGAVVAYSLGNFVSGMGASYDPAKHPSRKGRTRDTVVLQLELDVGDEVTVRSVRATPFFAARTDQGIVLKELSSLQEDLALTRRAEIEAILGDVVSARSRP